MKPRSPSRPAGAARLAAGLLLPLGACMAPAPPMSVHTDVGVVRADDGETARRYAALLVELHPKVSRELPGALVRPTELWVQDVLRRWADEEHRSEAMGFTILSRNLTPGRIHLRRRTAYPEWYLAHELGHALMGPTWEALPGVLSEGLCDWLAARVNPELRPVIQTHRLLHASLFFGGMSYQLDYTHPESGEKRRTEVWYTYQDPPPAHSAAEVLGQDRWSFHSQEDVPVSHYGLGFVVVSLIAQRRGIEGLHDLCRAATDAGHRVVPTAWILDAAGVEDPAGWARAARSLLGEAELYEVARLVPTVFRELSSRTLAARFPELENERLLDVVNPRLSLADGAVVPLAALEAVRADGTSPSAPGSAADAPAVASSR